MAEIHRLPNGVHLRLPASMGRMYRWLLLLDDLMVPTAWWIYPHARPANHRQLPCLHWSNPALDEDIEYHRDSSGDDGGTPLLG